MLCFDKKKVFGNPTNVNLMIQAQIYHISQIGYQSTQSDYIKALFKFDKKHHFWSIFAKNRKFSAFSKIPIKHLKDLMDKLE